MFEYIKGNLIEASLSKAIIETHGVGYQILIPINNYAKLPSIGSSVMLYIATVIREDSHKNYGFLSREQRDLFEMLIEVSGVGPKTGLALIGHMDIDDFQFAIAQGQVAVICKIPGIGKKTAERLIIELRDKMVKLPLKESKITTSSCATGLINDAISALTHLGYHPAQAQKAVKSALEGSETLPALPLLITAALRRI